MSGMSVFRTHKHVDWQRRGMGRLLSGEQRHRVGGHLRTVDMQNGSRSCRHFVWLPLPWMWAACACVC